MEVSELEVMLRRVVREELESLLAAGNVDSSPVTHFPAPDINQFHPFDLSDAELCAAERLLPEDEQPILRHRVMAVRADKLGHSSLAKRMRKKADRLEQQLRLS